MKMMARIAFLLVFALALAAAPAASAQWSPPEKISRAAENLRPQTAFAAGGAQLTAWTRFTRERPSILASQIGVVAERGDALAGPVGYGQGRFAMAWTDERHRRLFTRLGDARRRFASGRRIASPMMAGNLDGDLALAWFDDRGTSNDEVLVAIRRPGGGFRAPVRLAREKVRSVSVAVGPRGKVLVAWDAYGKVRTRLRRGSRFGRTDTIRSFQAFNARLQTAVAENGRSIVGWTAKFRSEGGAAGPTYQQVAVRPSGGGRFRPAQRLSQTPDAPDVLGTLRLDATQEEALVAWTQEDGVFLSRADAAGVFGPGQAIAPPGAVLQDLAGGAAFWIHGRRLYADGVAISEPGAAGADAAADAINGRIGVVWLQDGAVTTSTRG
jgi:hypothetical protein